MSVPRQPSEPLRPAAPPGASEAEEAGLRPPLAGADSPIIDDASPEDQPNPDPD
jgi:hypothetical protein